MNNDAREDLPGVQQGAFEPASEPSALDHASVEWSRVKYCRYLLHQRLHYTYPCPIYDLNQRLMILPPEQYGDQRRCLYRFDVSLPTRSNVVELDAFGNTEVNLSVAEIPHAISFEAWIQLERWRGSDLQELSADRLSDPHLLEPSRLTRPDGTLDQVARQLLATGFEGLDLAHAINQWVYRHLQYAHEVTTIHTTAAEALQLGRGVCQDYAHVMLALCHLCALPARYVSGHMLGEGGTHAWVEVLIPAPGRANRALVVPLDPTHGRETNLSYLTISVGRDYYDVAPTSGTFRASCRGELTAYKRVDLTLLEYM